MQILKSLIEESMPSLIKVRQVKIKWLSEEGDTRGHWPEEETLISLSIWGENGVETQRRSIRAFIELFLPKWPTKGMNGPQINARLGCIH